MTDWRNWLANMLGVKLDDREALLDLLNRVQRENKNVLNAEEMQMIQGVMRMREWEVRTVMLPKNDITHLHIDYDYEKIVDVVCKSQHSRYPVFDIKHETVAGIFLAKDLLPFINTPANFDIAKVMRKPVFVPSSKNLGDLLKEFLASHSHMFIVLDEHRQTAGIVTIEDVLEQIVGEIYDESDDLEDIDKKRVSDNEYEIKANLSVKEFNAAFNASLPDDVDNIAGWLAAELGRMPKLNDTVTSDNLHFSVIEADERRIYKVKVTVN